MTRRFIAIAHNEDFDYTDQVPMMICDTMLQAVNACRIDMARSTGCFHGVNFTREADGSYALRVSDEHYYQVFEVESLSWLCFKFNANMRRVSVTTHTSQRSADKDAWEHWMIDVDAGVQVINIT